MHTQVPAQVFTNLVNGQSLFERIRADKAFVAENPDKAFPMGKTYYASLRTLFMPPASITATVKASDPSGKVSDAMRSAVLSWKKSRDRQPLKMYLRTATSLTENEVVASLKFFDALNPSGQGDQLAACLEVMSTLVRCGSVEKYPGWMVLCRQKFQAVLLQPTIWRLALPEQDVKKILDAKEGESWNELQTELESVTSACVLGQKVFGFVYTSMRRQFVRESIKQSIDKLGTMPKVSEAVLADSQRKLLKKLEDYLDKSLIQKKTKPEVIEYRGLHLSMDIGSVYEYIQLCFDAFVKSRAAAAGEVPLFGPESDIFGPSESGKVFEASSVARCKSAREYAAAVLAKGDYATAGEMQ
eukprot:6485661-Amphidinium_carterae.1